MAMDDMDLFANVAEGERLIMCMNGSKGIARSPARAALPVWRAEAGAIE